MFLNWASSLDLLEHGKDTNILKDFSLPVRRILVSQVVNFFLDPNTPASILSTPTHVHWVMECVGQGFLLPIEDMTVIIACIDLYKRWLMDPKSRPPPIQEDEQHFIRVIIQHFSLLFTPRVGVPKESADVHTVLCQRVLSIFLDFGRTGKPNPETWEIILKLQLGICDCILRGDQGVEEAQTRALAPLLLKVLFEMWLHSRTQDPDLWGSLVRLAANWLHLMPTAAQWNVTTLGLTNRMLALLYPQSDLTIVPSVVLKYTESDSVSLDLVPDHVFYDRCEGMLHVLGNLNILASPAIFVCAMTGLNNLVCQFLKVGRSPEIRDKPDVCTPKEKELKKYKQSVIRLRIPGKDYTISRPDGNTILHIFGSWLFEATKLNRTTFDEGTAIAVEALNHIFNICQHSGFEPVYLASFYSCMAEALSSEGRVLMSAVQYGQWLVFSELPGARVLAPLYHPSVAPPDIIRRCCIKILGGLICLPNRFGDLPIPSITSKPLKQGSAEKSLGEVVTYNDMLPHLSSLIISGLSTEKSPHNTELLLWYIPIFLREISTLSFPTPVNLVDFSSSAVEVIVTSVCGLVWNHDVCQVACRVLSVISRMYSQLPNGPELGYNITKPLSEFAANRIGLTAQDEELAATIILSVTDWALVDQWMLTRRDSLEVFLNVCMLGLGSKDYPPEPEQPAPPQTRPGASPTSPSSKKQRAPPGERLRQTAQFGLLNVLNNMGNFPPATGASRISSLISEEDVLQQIKEADPTISDPEDYVRYFAVDESIMLSVIDIPNGDSDPSCVIVVRDRTGKYVWKVYKPYLPFVPKSEQELEDKELDNTPGEPAEDLPRTPTQSPHNPANNSSSTGASSSSSGRPRALVSEGSSGDLTLLSAREADASFRNRPEDYQDLLHYIDGNSDDTFLTLAEKVMENEGSLLAKFKDQTMAVDIATQPPARRSPYLGPVKLQLGRQLLASLGLFSQCHSKVAPLHPGQSLSSCIKAIDAISERTQLKIGVIYAAKGQRVEDVFANVSGSQDYQEFLSTLGWPIHIPTHRGFLGGLDPKGQHGMEAPYYSNYALEAIFLVTSLMPNSFTDSERPNTTHKRTLLRGAPVVIVWAEDYKFDTTALTESVPLQIVIVPQTSGAYRVKILKTTSIAKIQIGPVCEDFIILTQKDIIRETAIIATQLIVPAPPQYTARRTYIEQMARSLKTPNMSLDVFYGKIFSPMPKTSFMPSSLVQPGGARPRPGQQGPLKFPANPPAPPPTAPTVALPQSDKFAIYNSFDSLPLPGPLEMQRSPSDTNISAKNDASSSPHSSSPLQSSGESPHTPPLAETPPRSTFGSTATTSPIPFSVSLQSASQNKRASAGYSDSLSSSPDVTSPLGANSSTANTSTASTSTSTQSQPTQQQQPQQSLQAQQPNPQSSPQSQQSTFTPAEKSWRNIRPSNPRPHSTFDSKSSSAGSANEESSSSGSNNNTTTSTNTNNNSNNNTNTTHTTAPANPRASTRTAGGMFEIGRKKQ